jgi:hypothetical protein
MCADPSLPFIGDENNLHILSHLFPTTIFEITVIISILWMRKLRLLKGLLSNDNN